MKSKLRNNQNGDEFWMLPNGDFHKEDGPALVYLDGDKEWWINGKLHRKNGPAVEINNGDEEWWLDGKLHREDGPAVLQKNIENWFLNDVEYTEEEFLNSIEYKAYARGVKLKRLL